MRTNKLARITGVVVLLLTGLVFGQADTFKIFVRLAGDVGNNFTTTATPQLACPSCAMPRGGGTFTGTTGCAFRNLSRNWGGKISVTGRGFNVTPKDTQIVNLINHITITFTVRDTMRPSVKIGHLNGITINVNQPFPFYDSIQDNSGRLSIMKHEYSVDGGITWDSACLQQYTAPSYFPIASNGSLHSGCAQLFTPTEASDNFKLRAIVVDYFGRADTEVVTFKVVNIVSTLNLKKSPLPKQALENSPTYDLSGRKILLTRGRTLKFYIRNNQRHLTIHQ